jgi:hypothetical protein
MRRLIFGLLPNRNDLLRFFFNRGWRYVREHLPEAGDTNPHWHWITWSPPNESDFTIDFLDDKLIGQQYFVLQGPDASREAEIETIVRGGRFDLLKNDDILRSFDGAEATNDLMKSFAKLALISPPTYDSVFAKAITRMLEHKDPAVRASGLKDLTYVGWPELKPFVEKLKTDPDDTVRANAQTVLDGYRELGIA